MSDPAVEYLSYREADAKFASRESVSDIRLEIKDMKSSIMAGLAEIRSDRYEKGADVENRMRQLERNAVDFRAGLAQHVDYEARLRSLEAERLPERQRGMWDGIQVKIISQALGSVLTLAGGALLYYATIAHH